MRVWPAALPPLLLIALVTTASVAGAPRIDRPTPLVTDHWRYAITGDIRSSLLGLQADLHVVGQRTVWVKELTPERTVLVEYTALDFRGFLTEPSTQLTLPVAIATASNFTATLGGMAAVPQGDMRFYVNLSATPFGLPFQASLEGSQRIILRENGWTFPLEVGKAGKSTSEVTIQAVWTRWTDNPLLGRPSPIDGILETTTNYLTRGAEEVTVPAGHFTTLRVDAWTNSTAQAVSPSVLLTTLLGLGNHTRTFHGVGVGNAVRTEYYDGAGRRVAVETLMEYRPPSPLSLRAAANSLRGPPPLRVEFTATPGGGSPPFSYTWDFGDGETSSLTNPLHTFESEGTYRVNVTVSDATGQRAWDELGVAVEAALPWWRAVPLDQLFLLPALATAAVAGAVVALVLRRRRASPPGGANP